MFLDNVWNDIHEGMRRVVLTHEQFNGLELHFQEKQVPPSWIFITRTMAFSLDIRHLQIHLSRSILLQCELQMDTLREMHA